MRRSTLRIYYCLMDQRTHFQRRLSLDSFRLQQSNKPVTLYPESGEAS